jgi:hypothetical protein
MSYDIELIRRDSFASFEDWAGRPLEDEETANPGPPDPAKEREKQRLAAALREANPALEPFQFGFAEIAQAQGISIDEAQLRWRHIELNGPDDGNGIQITISDDLVSITIPYWHQGEAAQRAFDKIWSYLRILQDVGGLTAVDPQIEKFLDLSTDQPAVLARYSAVVARIPETIPDAEQRSKRKPWWKFW